MFRLSKTAEYAIRAVLFLARESDQKAALAREIAQHEAIPAEYVSKVMRRLVRAGFVRSRPGLGGGFLLVKDPATFTLADIVDTFDGPIALNDCLVCGDACPREPICEVYPVWKKAREGFVAALSEQTIAELVRRPSGRESDDLGRLMPIHADP